MLPNWSLVVSRYLSWSKETFPTALQGEFLPLAERCIQTFWSHAAYKLDARFLRVCLQYADNVNNSLEIYAGMEQNGMGLQSALFWKARGRAYESREDWNNAEAMYQKGVDCLAKPIEMMKSIQTEFEARMFRRLKAEAAALKNGTAPAPGAAASGLSDTSGAETYDENRAPLSTLARSSEASARGNPSRAPAANGAAPLAANNKKRSSDHLQIFVDDEFATESEKRTRKPNDPSAPVAAPIAAVGALAVESKKENQREAEVWVNNTMPQDSRALAAVARVSKQAGSGRPQALQVFEDVGDQPQTPSTAQKHSTAFKQRDGTRLPRGVPGSSSAPYRFTIKSEFYARGSNEPTVASNGSLEKAAYDRTVVFPGDGKEYSFEEIRAKFYAERSATAAPSASAESSEFSSAPASVESSEMPGQEPTQQEEAPAQQEEVVVQAEEPQQETSLPQATDTSQHEEPSEQQEEAVAPIIEEVTQVAEQEQVAKEVENVEETTVAEDASDSLLTASTKSLVSEFESAAEIKVFEDNLDQSTSAVPEIQENRLAMQTLSDAVMEPLIERPSSQFAIYVDEDSQEGVEAKQEASQQEEPRRAFQPRSSIVSAVPATPKRTSILVASSGSGDENDPSVMVSPVAEKSSSLLDSFAPFEDSAPMTPVAAAPSHVESPFQAAAPLIMEPLVVLDDENVAPVVASPAPAPAVVEGGLKPRSRGLSMQSVSDLIQSEAEVVQREEDEKWSYNPEENATMSGFTRRTKDAMDEVMGMFQFDKTMTGISASSVDFDGNYEVTASIVIPFEHVNRALPQNDFAIFMDESPDQVESPAPVARRSSVTPSSDLLIVPYQDENASSSAPSSSAAMEDVQPLAQPLAPTAPSSAMSFEVFADPETPKAAAPASRLDNSAAPAALQFEVFSDPETPKASSAPASNDSAHHQQQLVDVETPPAPSRLSLILERTVEDETPEEDATLGLNGNTSTLNFTMSGITMSGADTTINTQNLGSIIARSNSAKKVNRPVYYTLSMQNPVVDPATGVVEQKLELTSSVATESGPAPLAAVPQWSQVSQAEQLVLMRDTGLDGVVELTTSNSPAAESFVEGASIAFGDESYLVLQRMAQVGADSYVYMLESESGETVLAQRGELYDFWACKRLLTKLNSAASSTSALSSFAIDDLYASLVDYTKAFVFGDSTWLFWPLKVKTEGNKSQNVPSTTLEKSFTNSLEQVIASRDAKGFDEIVVWYFAQRLARLQHALHELGFVAGGRMLTTDLFACSPAMDAATPFVGSRGLVLHRYSSLVDVESYSEGAIFTHGGNAVEDARLQGGASSLISQMIGAGDATTWTVEPDMAKTAMMVHYLLHGKAMALEQAAGGRWKSKVGPKMFWNVALWNTYFDSMLNGASRSERIEAQAALCAQVDTFIAAKGTALRFQMSKLSF